MAKLSDIVADSIFDLGREVMVDVGGIVYPVVDVHLQYGVLFLEIGPIAEQVPPQIAASVLGSQTTEAKRQAVRENGKKGGRPKTKTEAERREKKAEWQRRKRAGAKAQQVEAQPKLQKFVCASCGETTETFDPNPCRFELGPVCDGCARSSPEAVR
jgi:hypothetical protein